VDIPEGETRVGTPATASLPRNSYALTLPEAARQLNVSESSIRRWIQAGTLPAHRVGPGGRYRIALDDLDELLEDA
jgi:excisionase family DNA binding protein